MRTRQPKLGLEFEENADGRNKQINFGRIRVKAEVHGELFDVIVAG